MNRVVFEGKTEDGLNIIIGYPKRSGLLGMHNFINDLSAERTFVRNQGIQISLDEEKDFLGKQLKSTADNKSVQLLAICNNKLVGISGIEMRDRSQKHIGNFGISVTKGYRDKGIGSKLIDTVLKEATEKLPDLKIIVLTVFVNNPIAKDLYKKFGFTEYGRLSKGVAHREKFVDEICMYKEV